MNISDPYRIADLCREQPFWDSSILPASRTSFQSLGNTVAVGRFPTPVPFILRTIICGQGMVSLQVEITASSHNDSHNDDAHDTAQTLDSIFSSPPRSVELRSIIRRSSGQLGIATVEEHVAPVFSDGGIYMVVVTLNGKAAGRLPLFVRLEH